MSSGKLHVRKGDRVLILSGKDKGKKAKVIGTYPQKNQVLVEGINIITKHAKPTQKVPQGGIRQMEAPLHASNVMLVCPSCQSPTRVQYNKISGGRKMRGCKRCGESIDK